jgi:hypothetical protein
MVTPHQVRLVLAPPASEAARRYPLATRSGVELLGLILAADEHWRPLTRLQRAALRCGYHNMLAAVQTVAAEDVPPEGLLVDLPELLPDTHAATVRALERRGLAADGRLTPLAVEVVQLADNDRRPAT